MVESMDLTTTRTIDMTKFALDGLMTRQKAITANMANVMTPGYQRQEVSFENQLKEIVEKEDLKIYIKEQNSIQYNPTSLDLIMGNNIPDKLTPQKARYLQTDSYSNYNPQIMTDTISESDETGNNINIEKEVMDMAAVGLRYNVLATLEQKQLRYIAASIKGDM
jgi:flagellar basal body rod protein FlgB